MRSISGIMSRPMAHLARCIPVGMLAAMLLLVIGCGESPPVLVPVTGKVEYQGKAVTAGSIILHPMASNAYQKDKPSSLLELDGSFTIKTFPFGEGVPVGSYQVTLAPEVANRLRQPKYADPAKTPWTLDVPATGVKDHRFEVK
ncbi:hypothetical protein [Tuwongella immobilis]|uniref:Carboxypeptidase regulatory-like domain-containing protein n=1 Tax=Tuwongella immobilis TaxID=692036 RepID=A0A6C2YWB9_9BACT|nr:hypothetical protein [Tuwongella immobilis]VIP05453.1 Uncharacterized protein OS=Singulisphaera acidiphila (strain ATCC BAA-1392 / DSM 18658 / VKM B-2454 / MOB10) GN=Sinac_0124 PE=4 SV=1 [Tuwongella immobilis]VTS08262.1 Uncharacterized protein OS=Singulisphaera acidiphila (strain ATCC BAA-1392 / DSM 18658 / VKM B-2454 / MOB10) GN=Sinac_0124 PE=4 SV=1 [Tuwongella immobilis]